ASSRKKVARRNAGRLAAIRTAAHTASSNQRNTTRPTPNSRSGRSAAKSRRDRRSCIKRGLTRCAVQGAEQPVGDRQGDVEIPLARMLRIMVQAMVLA